MEKYTVALFGHRVMRSFPVNEMFDLFQSILEEHKYVEFLIGHDGAFDSQAAAVIRELMQEHQNCALTLVLPYQRAEYTKNLSYFQKRYTTVKICEASAKEYYKNAFSVRNRNMVDHADSVVCGIEHPSGGAWDAVQYAIAKKKKVINVCSLAIE